MRAFASSTLLILGVAVLVASAKTFFDTKLRIENCVIIVSWALESDGCWRSSKGDFQGEKVFECGKFRPLNETEFELLEEHERRVDEWREKKATSA